MDYGALQSIWVGLNCISHWESLTVCIIYHGIDYRIFQNSFDAKIWDCGDHLTECFLRQTKRKELFGFDFCKLWASFLLERFWYLQPCKRERGSISATVSSFALLSSRSTIQEVWYLSRKRDVSTTKVTERASRAREKVMKVRESKERESSKSSHGSQVTGKKGEW